jgi:hypothetical protein
MGCEATAADTSAAMFGTDALMGAWCTAGGSAAAGDATDRRTMNNRRAWAAKPVIFSRGTVNLLGRRAILRLGGGQRALAL